MRKKVQKYPRVTAPLRVTSHMRRILNQAANAAAKSKGTIFKRLSIADWYRAWDTIRPSGPLPIGFAGLIWIILSHRGVRYEERGPSVNAKTRRHRT